MKIRFKKLNENAVMPTKAHASDAGFDLTATSRVFDDRGAVVYGCGLAVEIPQGYVGLVFPRSSIAKKDLLLSNSVGVIDSGYRGEIMAKFKPSMLYVDNVLCEGYLKETDIDDPIGSVQTDPKKQSVSAYGLWSLFFGDNPCAEDGRAEVLCGNSIKKTFPPRLYEIGERFAQLIIMPIPDIEWEEAEELSDSDRGNGGYGSTGK